MDIKVSRSLDAVMRAWFILKAVNRLCLKHFISTKTLFLYYSSLYCSILTVITEYFTCLRVGIVSDQGHKKKNKQKKLPNKLIMLNVWRLTDNHPTANACSVLWSPFLRLGWNSGKVPPKTQNDPVLTVIIATFEKFIKKKLTKKKKDPVRF